jgi:hypothetical protein
MDAIAIRSLARSPFTRAKAFVEGQVSDRVRYLWSYRIEDHILLVAVDALHCMRRAREVCVSMARSVLKYRSVLKVGRVV